MLVNSTNLTSNSVFLKECLLSTYTVPVTLFYSTSHQKMTQIKEYTPVTYNFIHIHFFECIRGGFVGEQDVHGLLWLIVPVSWRGCTFDQLLYCSCSIFFSIGLLLGFNLWHSGAKWYLTVVLICIYLMSDDVEYFLYVYWTFGYPLLMYMFESLARCSAGVSFSH